jgi:hypothetical protein
MRIRIIIALVVLLSVAGLAQASMQFAAAPDRVHSPELPSPLCNGFQLQPGNRMFDAANYDKKVGIHQVGPTWASNGRSKVVTTKLGACSPDPTAVPWLLLQPVTNEGPGVSGSTTYIQRVNTKAGLTLNAPGRSTAALGKAPYTERYYPYHTDSVLPREISADTPRCLAPPRGIELGNLASRPSISECRFD